MALSLGYEIRIPRPEAHLVEVRLTVEGWIGGPLLLSMPAWAPGSYLIRDFARHVQDFEARSAGKTLPWTRLDKHTWSVEAGFARRVEIRYRVYANELSVQTSHVDETHAFLNGTSVFLYLREHVDAPASVRVRPPRGWRVDTGLPLRGGAYRARDYDHLADCPFEIGTHRRLTFQVQGKDHVVALYGRGNEDAERIRRDLRRIVEEEAAIFRELPYDRYVFIVHLSDKARGGLEHENSNVSAVDRNTFKPDKKYHDFLALEAHEFFHLWNVKRIKPSTLGPFDYDREVHTTLLWAMEGLTSYYDELVLVRAGLSSEERYREHVADLVGKLREHAGRFKMSLEESSYLTWVKLYKMDENWPNTGVSYYLKGELVGLLLDLAIRDRTNGRRGLDDVFRLLWKRHGRAGAGLAGAAEWRRALEDATGLDWGAFWRRYVSGTADLDFEKELRVVGWKISPVFKGQDADAKRKGEVAGPGGWLGVALKTEDGRVKVKSVTAKSPAEEAGLSAGDELVALDGVQILDEEFLVKRLAERRAGDRVRIARFRRRELVQADVTLGRSPPEKWKIEVADETPRSRRLKRAWLRGRGR